MFTGVLAASQCIGQASDGPDFTNIKSEEDNHNRSAPPSTQKLLVESWFSLLGALMKPTVGHCLSGAKKALPEDVGQTNVCRLDSRCPFGSSSKPIGDFGYSQRHEEIRTWKVDRIQAAEVTEQSFVLPTDFDLDAHLAGAFAIVRGEKPVDVTMRFMGTATRYVQKKRMHPTQHVVLQPDGSVLAHFELTSTLEVRSWILSFGSAAEVLSPANLRVEVKREVVRMLAHYDHQGSNTDGRDGSS